MTAKEVCQMFGCSENSLRTNFNRTAASIKRKYDVDIFRLEKGKEKYYQIFEDKTKRALTIYNEENNIPITLESLGYEAYQFYIFLALAASQQGVYRGSQIDLLRYIGVQKPQKRHIDNLKKAINSLVQKKCVVIHEDQDYIILYLKRGIESKYLVKINMLKECQKIANENHKQFTKIPQFIQVWEAVRICAEKQPFTYADLAKLTGLSYKQIRDVRRLLESNDAFKTSRAGSYFLNMGSNVELNGFFE